MITSPPEGRNLKDQIKGVGSMVHGQVFLKGGLVLFLFNFFKVYYFLFLHLEITLPFAKLSYAFEEKLLFSVRLIL